MKKFIALFFCLCTLNACHQSIDKGLVYHSDNLTIEEISEGIYIHTSFLKSKSFGKVPCNGLIVTDEDEAVVYDTPVDSISTIEVIDWISDSLGFNINSIVVTHFHVDCIGGLSEFHKRGINSICNKRTFDLVDTSLYDLPKKTFSETHEQTVGGLKVESRFWGAGHTNDNIVGYIPARNILFGGCLIKSIGSGKGNLNDADQVAWPKTVTKLKQAYPRVEWVVPGHGKYGDQKLLDYTIELMSSN